MRLAIAADAFCDRRPGDTVLKGWAHDLSKASISYQGEEILTCLKVEAKLLEPGLPLVELTGSLPLEELVDGHTREFLVDPELLRRHDDDNVVPWPRPRIHAVDSQGKDEVFTLMARYGILAQDKYEAMYDLGFSQSQRPRSVSSRGGQASTGSLSD